MRVDQAPAFHRGATRVPAAGIASQPLGYLRDDIEPGGLLPNLPASALPKALALCDELVFSFDGKLGDTLLAIGAVAALLEYLTMARPDRLPTIRTRGPHRGLFAQLPTAERFETHDDPAPHPAARRVAIGDRQGLSTSRDDAGRILLEYECNPEQPPCWSSGRSAYPFLPARYFLSIEQQVGTRLAEPGGFMPTMTTKSEQRASRLATLTVGIVTATSWPTRKDYGVDRFLDVLGALAEEMGEAIHVLIAQGKEDAPLNLPASPLAGLTVESLGDSHYIQVAEQLATCDLVVGNDTGLTHLAAATRLPDGSGPQVIGLHARHSHTKWRTGLEWHHALATPFSERMHREDLCPVRDRIDDQQFGSAADIGSIQVSSVVDAAKAVLIPLPEASR